MVYFYLNYKKIFNMKKTYIVIIIVIILVVIIGIIYNLSHQSPAGSGQNSVQNMNTSGFVLKNRTILATVGNPGRLDWSGANNLIAYDSIGSSGYAQIWTINPDKGGSTNYCVTCTAAAKAALPGYNTGNPVWSRDGHFIIFQVEEISYGSVRANSLDFGGSGWDCDLWAADPTGQHFWRLTDQGTSGYGGVVHPQFNWKGNELTWGQRVAVAPKIFGTWELAIAQWSVKAGVPSLSNTNYYQPVTPTDQ